MSRAVMRLLLVAVLALCPIVARADLDQAVQAYNTDDFERAGALAAEALDDAMAVEDVLVAREILLISAYMQGRLDADLLSDLQTLDRDVVLRYGALSSERLSNLFVISDLLFELGHDDAATKADVSIARIALRSEDAVEDLLWALRNLATAFEADPDPRVTLQFTELFVFMATDFLGPENPMAMEAQAMAALALIRAGEHARAAQKVLSHTEDTWLDFAATGDVEDELVATLFAEINALPISDENAWLADIQRELDAHVERERLIARISDALEEGKLDFSSPAYARALDDMNTYLDVAYPEDPVAAFYLNQIMKSYLETGQFGAARPYLAGLLSYAPAYAAVLDIPIGTLAATLAGSGGIEDALFEPMLRKAIAIDAVAPGDDPEVLFDLLIALGQIKDREGEWSAALAFYRMALDQAELHPDVRFRQLGLALNGAGLASAEIEQLNDARTYHARMLELANAEGDADAASAALGALSRVAIASENHDEALRFARQKHGLERGRHDSDPDSVRIAEMNLAMVLLTIRQDLAPELVELLPGIFSGETSDEYVSDVRSVLMVTVAERLGATPSIVAEHAVFQAASNTQKAQLVAFLARAAVTRTDYADASRWIEFGRGLAVQDSPEYQSLAWSDGAVALAEGRTTDALLAFREITDDRIARPGASGTAFDHVPYHLGTAMRLALDAETGEDLRFHNEAFLLAQLAGATKAGRALNSALIREDADDRTRILLRERERLNAEIGVMDAAIAQARYDGKSADNFSQQREELRQSHSALSDAIARADPALAEISNMKPLALGDVAGRLSDNEVLAIYATSDQTMPDGTPASFLVALSHDSVLLTDLPSRADLTALSAALRCSAALTDPTCAQSGAGETRGSFFAAEAGQSQTPAFETQLAHRAYQDLIAPMAELLDGKDRLIVVPDQALISHPFHLSLRAPLAAGLSLDAGHWLIRDMSIEIAPTVASFAAMRDRAGQTAKARSFLGVGDPLIGVQRQGAIDFDCDPGRSDSVAIAALAPAALKRSTGPDRARLVADLTALPDTRCELREIAGRFGESRLLLQQDATESAIKEMSATGKLRRYSVVNFATHGLIAGEIGVNDSGLVMTPPAIATANDDGLLTTSEIASLDLDADFVILSACNTASGDSRSDEGLSGLASAFFVSGARSLMVSHWPVYSDAAVDLTTRTLDILDKTPATSRADAIRYAMLSILDDPASTARTRHPAYWAPFMIVGDGLGASAKQ
ncbi:MAG: CHAT domain-containing protein [Pseudomonadota bacterium]